MPLDLTSVEGKFARAKSHFEAYRSELKLWRDSKPYRISGERSPDFTRYYLVFRINKQPDFVNWTLIIGDCIHNLRSSLEHLVYAIAIHESGINPPPRDSKLAFPITDTPSEFIDIAARRIGDGTRPGDLSGAVRTAIESVQPYNRTNKFSPPFLALLRQFANRDKHKLLDLVFMNQMNANVGLSLPTDRSGRGTVFTNYGEIKDDTPLITWVFEKPEPGMQFENAEIAIAVSLRHEKRDASDPKSAPMNEATALLNAIITEVRFVIDTVVASVV